MKEETEMLQENNSYALHDELSRLFTHEELSTLSTTLRNKINNALYSYRVEVMQIQDNLSYSNAAYEKSIENQHKRFQEENQKRLEAELTSLKYKTALNEYEGTVERRPGHRKYTRHNGILQKQIKTLKDKSNDLILREQSLNAQVTFLIENYDKEAQELCSIVGSYLLEINDLRNKVENGSFQAVKELKEELQKLRRNESEYQTHAYKKAEEIHELTIEIYKLKTRNDTLEQYKSRCNLLHDEVIRLTTQLNEAKLKGTEMRNSIQTSLFNEIDSLKEHQSIIAQYIKQAVEQKGVISTGRTDTRSEALLDVAGLKVNLNTIKRSVELIEKSKRELEIVIENIQLNRTVRKQNDSVAGKDNVAGDEVIMLLRMENEELKARVSSIRPARDILEENEEVINQNRMLIMDIKCLREELDDTIKSNNELQRYVEEAQIRNRELDDCLRAVKEGNEKLMKEQASTRKEVQRLNEENRNLSNEASRVESLKEEISGLKEKVRKGEEQMWWMDDRMKQYEGELEELEKENRYLRSGKQSTDNKKEEYIESLKEQLGKYKEDVKLIESQFSQYKKLYESFSIEETQRRIMLLKENLEKKDLLIKRLEELTEKYRRLV
ncbi:hypothetical protein GINT2_001407 [Glugoides intestinalis]